MTARVEFVDPAAMAQLRVFAVLSGLAVFGTSILYARWLDGRQPPDGAILGLLGVTAAWVVAIIGGRVWVERHRVVHTAVFPLGSLGQVSVRRNWAVAFILAVLFTPIVGLGYVALARGRIVRVRAPFMVGRSGALRLRLSGSEEEGRRLERLAIGATVAT